MMIMIQFYVKTIFSTTMMTMIKTNDDLYVGQESITNIIK